MDKGGGGKERGTGNCLLCSKRGFVFNKMFPKSKIADNGGGGGGVWMGGTINSSAQSTLQKPVMWTGFLPRASPP